MTDSTNQIPPAVEGLIKNMFDPTLSEHTRSNYRSSLVNIADVITKALDKQAKNAVVSKKFNTGKIRRM